MKKEETKNYLVAGTLNNYLEKKNLNEKFTNKDIVTFITFGVASIASLGALLVSTPVCVSLAAIATTIAIYEYKNAKKFDNTESRLRQENNHIEKLLNGQVNESDELVEKRKNKLISLSKLREEKEKDVDYYNTLSNIIYASTIIASIAVAGFGGLSYELILPILGVASSAIISNAEIRKHKECEVVENRINNLIHDLGVEYCEKEEKTIKTEKQEDYLKSEFNEFCKTYDETHGVHVVNKDENKKCFGYTYEEFCKLYEENNGFDVRYPDEKPKEYSKSKTGNY